jgi:3-oxoacyl-[acyl-carrier protein] reductase
VLLEGRNAIIYGGGGSVGSAVAEAFAREGARVHVVGRSSGPIETVAGRIRDAGGMAETAIVDALSETAVDAHADAVASRFGSLDVSFNLISHGDVQGTPLAEMTLDDFERPIVTAMRTMFITTRAAARHMIPQRSGVILVFGGYGDPPRGYNLGGLQMAFQVQEALRRSLAVELAPYGVRTLTIQTSGIAETIPPGFEGRERIVEGLDSATLLGRAASLADVANAAVFAASDKAASMTGTKLNITAGATFD